MIRRFTMALNQYDMILKANDLIIEPLNLTQYSS